jgi:formate dehydrogenase major subunit
MSDGLPMIEGVKVPSRREGGHGAAGRDHWAVASRNGTEIPHLCHSPAPATARRQLPACMVEIEGERVLAASCVRKPTAA